MERIQPYRAALHRFTEIVAAHGTDFAPVLGIIERELGRPVNPDTLDERAYLSNLAGIVALMRRDTDAAEAAFRSAIEARPGFEVGRINLAFGLVQRDHYRAAIDLLEPLVEGGFVRQFSAIAGRLGPLRATLHNTLGIARWGLGDLDGADREFRRATEAHPESEAAFTYWSQLLAERGNMPGAAAMAAAARANSATFQNYPEVAGLYFWMSPRNSQPLTPRR
jgi:predicted Zn-dependent protease